jgi:outer membrane lipoprotein
MLLAAWIAGCSYPISKEYREAADPNLSFPLVLEDPLEYAGSTVIWGGRIIKVVNHLDSTELFILEAPLDYTQEPGRAESSRGRFIVRSKTFLDPEVYKKGLKVTVAGRVLGKETLPLGQAQYNYPIISVRQLYLWRAERQRRNDYYPYQRWPGFWGPPRPPWGW